MPHRFEMHAQLVRAAGDRRQLDAPAPRRGLLEQLQPPADARLRDPVAAGEPVDQVLENGAGHLVAAGREEARASHVLAEARERDEQLGRRFGLIGQETVGVGGLTPSMAGSCSIALDTAVIVTWPRPSSASNAFVSRFVKTWQSWF